MAHLLSTAIYGKTYDVGPDQQRKTLAAVPWSRLSAGDIVNIHRAPQCYAEKILISTQGKSWGNPILVQGVLDSEGNRPCVTGRNAVQARTSDDYWSGPAAGYSEAYYVIGIGLQEGARFGPRYIILKNLEVTGAEENGTYISADRVRRRYLRGVSGIRIVNGSHIRIENCWVHGIGGTGIFAKPLGSMPGRMEDINLWYNRIGGNGVEGTIGSHNTYIESDGAVYYGNLYEPLISGALGGHLKDRSAGTVIAHNHFSGSAKRYIDLVDPADGWPIFGAQPYFGYDFVFGNIFRITAGATNAAVINTPIHYGGDSGFARQYRKGVLSFYHNTFVVIGDKTDFPHIAIFQPELASAILDLRNNVFAFFPRTTGGRIPEIDLLAGSEDIVPGATVNLGVNWINQGWQPCFPHGQSCLAKAVLGESNLITGAEPALVDRHDYPAPADGSPLIGVGGALSELVAKNPLQSDYTPNVQYVFEERTEPRKTYGPGGDLGALSHVSGSRKLATDKER